MTSTVALAGRRPRVHQLKVECEFYTPLSMHLKNFEVRKNDRDFQVNDILILREWSVALEAYTGLRLRAQISYILDDPRFCKEGYVILGLKFIEAQRGGKRMTHYEQIINMSIDELAEFIVSVSDDALQGEYWDTEKSCKEWLEMETRE